MMIVIPAMPELAQAEMPVIQQSAQQALTAMLPEETARHRIKTIVYAQTVSQTQQAGIHGLGLRQTTRMQARTIMVSH